MSSVQQTKRERQRERRRVKEEILEETNRKRRARRRVTVFSILGAIAIGIFFLVFFIQQSGDDDETASITTTTQEIDLGPNYTPYTESDYGTGDCPPDEVPSPPKIDFDDAPQLCLDPSQEYEAVFTTSEGVVKVRLDTENAPGTANNFYVLAKQGYYDGTLLFRTDTSIDIIQGGSPHTNSTSDQGPGYRIKDEGTGFSYAPGQLVMARSSGVDSSGAQFFFSAGPSTAILDGQGVFVVFGETTEGLDVLESILALHVEDPASGLGGAPSRDVVVEKVEVNIVEDSPIQDDSPEETTTTQMDILNSDEESEDDLSPNYTPYTESDYGTGECPPDEVPNPPKISYDDAPQLCLDPSQEYEAVFTTSEGVVKVRLDTENTPGTVNNFYVLSKYGYYDGTLLFRTDPSIDIIQGGAPSTNSPSDPGPGYRIKDEGTEFSYVSGQLVMARSQGIDTGGAQFFFSAGPRTALLDSQGVYVVFGETTEGLDVLESILALHVDDPSSPLGGGPSRDVVIEKLEVNVIGDN